MGSWWYVIIIYIYIYIYIIYIIYTIITLVIQILYNNFLGQREFVNMLPLVCNDAAAILFMFDLTRKSTLNSIKEWFRQARGFNKVCLLDCFEYGMMSFIRNIHYIWFSY